jgi:hypothetical protein
MITIDSIDDHKAQPQTQKACRQAPGVSLSGLGELRQFFCCAYTRHRSLLDIARRRRRNRQDQALEERSDTFNPAENQQPAKARPGRVVDL